MAHYEQFFRQADTDNSGFLTLEELTSVLKKNGYNEAKIKATFASVDSSGDKKISLDEFLSAMGQRPSTEHKAARLRACFQSFDKNGDGTISSSEMDAVYKEAGKCLSDVEMKRLMAKVDRDGSGTISYEEFVKEVFGKDA